MNGTRAQARKVVIDVIEPLLLREEVRWNSWSLIHRGETGQDVLIAYLPDTQGLRAGWQSRPIPT